MIYVPEEFRPNINIAYPPNNHVEFERWFYENYEGDVSDREYLGVFWTGYYVNNNYGQDKVAIRKLQNFLNLLDRTKKYFTVIQYDDSVLNDVSNLDLYQFNMSKPYDWVIPLMGMEQPFVFNEQRKYFASFVGNITHEIRRKMISRSVGHDYYISTSQHSIESYCRILAQSIFGLCPRGYGLTSFRATECLQFGAIPVYVSDNFLFPHKLDFNEYGVIIKENDIDNIGEILSSLSENDIDRKREVGKEIYRNYYTYESNKKLILNHLKNGI